MGFGKKTMNIQNYNFENLQASELWVFAQFMGGRREIAATPEPERRRKLAMICGANPVKAQIGFDVIVLGKEPLAAMPASSQAKVLIDIMNTYMGDLNNAANIKLNGALEAANKIFRTTAQDALAEAIGEARKRTQQLEVVIGTKKKKIKETMPPEFKTVIELVTQGIPVLLVGPTGCGKTFIAEKVAEALGLDFSDQSCSEGMSESIFNGLLLPIGKQGAFQHVNSPFIQRYEEGGLMLLDEIDAADPNLLVYMNKAVANKSYTVPQRWEDPVIKKHLDFRLIAAANTFGNGANAMYCGRNALDAATLDRFKVGLITMDYSRDVEGSLANKLLCEWAWKIREKIQKHNFRRVMSTRVISDLQQMTDAYKWGEEEWQKAYFAGWPKNEMEACLEKPLASASGMKYLSGVLEDGPKIKIA
jgi:cobaltochelatase CobS